MLAGDVVNEGELDVPSPENLFMLRREDTPREEEMLTEADKCSSRGRTSSKSTPTVSLSSYNSKDIIEIVNGGASEMCAVGNRSCDCRMGMFIKGY